MKEYYEDINWDIATKVISGEANQHEIEALHLWINQCEDHKKEWETIQLGLIQSEEVIISHSIDTDDAWLNVKNQLKEKKHPQIKRWPAYAAAAVILLLIGIILPTLWSSNQSLQTANTSLLHQKLPDGSIIDLNRESKLTLQKQFGQKTRSVDLEGEAYFIIQPNKKVPFIIRVADIKVTVTGTSFNIKNTNNLTEINITSGHVKAEVNDQQTIFLEKGDQLVYDARNGAVLKDSIRNENFLAWKTKRLIFKEEQLSRAIEIIENIYQVKLNMTDSVDTSELYLTATFSNNDIDFITDVLSKTFHTPFVYTKEKN